VWLKSSKLGNKFMKMHLLFAIPLAVALVPLYAQADCNSLEQESTSKIEQISRDYSTGGACMAAKGRKLMAQVAIDLADRCPERGESSIQLRQQGEQQMAEAKQTINDVCGGYND
jgi:hypothetical protein